ncbi:UbiA family prenyltransferase [Reichenbachiella agarivorans]|uniref:UbiA family prenyltransferase n=1 Tax=Reichenbachiella agarivorans TaxID=2979464 RepID=A0ABY6CWE6_9BACT|nr:UbiA family prenyltransferase [Reichenbachiella agarivorans]UXP33773.1 UbiA family prenyltransferase [Reichenbachiella agarivorans]
MTGHWIKRTFQVVTWLSLDIALSAAVLSNAVAVLFEVELPWAVSAALFLCVWMIYTLDHLLDAKKLNQTPTMPRHAFHYRFATRIFIALLIVALFSLGLVFFLPAITLVYGIVVAGLVGLYILLTWWLKIFIAKEFLISILYAVGVFIGPFSCGLVLSEASWLVFFEIMFLAVINLMLFSMYEQEKDRIDGFSSWATIFGQSRLRQMLRTSFVGMLVLLGMSLAVSLDPMWLVFQCVVLVMIGVLFLLYLRRNLFYHNEYYRWVGDMIFFFPSVVFLF